ncbi:MAG: TatD family hydrolase [Oligoflexia bacterium]|nr:TatD family hydrolase [Oligoflexia bacterium]
MSKLKQLWIDTHAHIDKLKLSPEEVLKEAEQAGVFRILTIGTELGDWRQVVALSEKHAPQVYGALGMHPHTAKDFNEESEDFLKKHLNLKRIVALGEIGLDYFYKNSEIQKQKEVFERQMSLAGAFNLPVEIHTREAEEDTVFFFKAV